MTTELTFPATPERAAVTIRSVNGVKIESSWRLQTDWCEITLPRKVADFDRQRVRDVFRVGDPVVVKLGANGQEATEFRGYLTAIGAAAPILLKAQDEMWRLKQMAVNVSLNKATLPELMGQIAPGYAIDALEIELGTVRFRQTTVAEVLGKLKEEFGLHGYYQEGKLIVGKIYADNRAAHAIHLERDVVKNDLDFRRADERKVEITAVSTLASGDKLEVKVGDSGGEPRQLTFYDIEDKTALKALAEQALARHKVDGYEGTLEIFGHARVRHGDKATLTSDLYPERDGRYYIDKVEVKLTDSPLFHKVITLGQKVA